MALEMDDSLNVLGEALKPVQQIHSQVSFAMAVATQVQPIAANTRFAVCSLMNSSNFPNLWAMTYLHPAPNLALMA